jgi:long-subunit fatty acid transport protein
MKSSLAKRRDVTIVAAFLSFASVFAQPAAGPLTVQGLDQFMITGARSRAMGGTNIAVSNDASALFSNPAALSLLSSAEIRASGFFQSSAREQTQHWVPLKNLPSISVLFEGLSGTIKAPVDITGTPLSAWNTLQKPYDTIGPNWNTTSSTMQPLTFVGALPLKLADLVFVAGIGISQVINLDHYFQNNNAMTPYLGHERPYGQWSKPLDTLHVKWYQYMRSRDGSIYGVTPGISMNVLPDLTIGGSVTLLSGSSDDLEQRVERGNLSFAINQGEAKDFMVDTVYYYQTKKGTSTFTGTIFNIGLLYQQPRYSIGLTVKPPMTLSRSWDRDVSSIDSTKKPIPIRIDSLIRKSFHETGKDNLKFPLVYSLGIVLKPTEKWTVAFDYEVRNLAEAELTSSSSGTASNPWINSKAAMRFGAEYRASDMLSLRAGYRQDIQAFSPDGSAIIDNPASGDIYSVGAGLKVGNMMIDFAYEYSLLKYQDIYQSNVNYNTREQHQVVVECAYRF